MRTRTIRAFSAVRSVATALLLLPVSALAQQQGVSFVLPGAAEADGLAGAHFSSLLSFANPGSTPIDVTVGLLPYAGVDAPAQYHGTIGPGSTLVLDPALPLMFGDGKRIGTLRVLTSELLPTTLITSNVADPAGTYGLAVPRVSRNDLLGRAATGHFIWADQNDAFRTNVGLSLLDPGSSATVRVYDDAGNLLGQTAVSSDVTISWQRSVAGIVSGPVDHGRVEITTVSGSVTGYVSVLDNRTSDGIALLPDRRTSDTWLLDGVSHSAGTNGTYFVTDVRIWNPGASPLDVTFEEVGLPGTFAPQVRTVPPGGVAAFDDVLASVLGAGEGVAGALRLSADAPFLAAGRTSNVAGGIGSFGAFVRAVAPGEFVGAGGSAVLSPITLGSASGDFRTNVALAAGRTGAKGKMVLVGGSSGSPPEVAFELGPDEWVQKRLSTWFGQVPSFGNRFILLTVDSGSLDAYASRIDNGTGDATVIPPTVLEAGASVVVPCAPR